MGAPRVLKYTAGLGQDGAFLPRIPGALTGNLYTSIIGFSRLDMVLGEVKKSSQGIWQRLKEIPSIVMASPCYSSSPDVNSSKEQQKPLDSPGHLGGSVS